jgi:hypothetical protein
MELTNDNKNIHVKTNSFYVTYSFPKAPEKKRPPYSEKKRPSFFRSF